MYDATKTRMKNHQAAPTILKCKSTIWCRENKDLQRYEKHKHFVVIAYRPAGDRGVTSALDCPRAEATTNQTLFETENLFLTVAPLPPTKL